VIQFSNPLIVCLSVFYRSVRLLFFQISQQFVFYGVGFYSLAQPPTWRTRPPNLCPPETGWPSYTPRHWVSLLVVSYDTQGYGGVILLRPNTQLFGFYCPFLPHPLPFSDTHQVLWSVPIQNMKQCFRHLVWLLEQVIDKLQSFSYTGQHNTEEHGHTSMSLTGFELSFPVLEWSMFICAFGRIATVITHIYITNLNASSSPRH
jgi:hypothetical protein